MTITIALAGKGGVGKTTIAGMVIKYIVKNKGGPVLAIDADPSSNLNMVLGLELESTIGDIREDMLMQVQSAAAVGGAAMGSLPGGIAKRDYLDLMIRSSVSEGENVDLIAMGRSEGPGCYCAVNHNLREVVDSISKNYRYVVIDNEAGMEHLSRRTTRDVQHLIIVSDPTLRGLVAAGRIAAIRNELDIRIENAYLIINRLIGPMPAVLESEIKKMEIPLLGSIPSDQQLSEFELTGEPIVDMGDNSLMYQAVAEMIAKINL